MGVTLSEVLPVNNGMKIWFSNRDASKFPMTVNTTIYFSTKEKYKKSQNYPTFKAWFTHYLQLLKNAVQGGPKGERFDVTLGKNKFNKSMGHQ